MDIKRTLEEEARKCQWLVLWLDGDSEGENIAFEVIEVCTAVNRHITIWRALFSSVTERYVVWESVPFVFHSCPFLFYASTQCFLLSNLKWQRHIYIRAKSSST